MSNLDMLLEDLKEAKSQPRDSFSPRVRFNWGYHDAADDKKKGRLVRRAVTSLPKGRDSMRFLNWGYDAYYASGYAYGINDYVAGEYTGDSSKAWKKFPGVRKAKIFVFDLLG